MSNSMYMAFMHFPKNYTKNLITYIDDREYFDLQSRAYIHLTMESELINYYLFNE